MGGPPGSLAGAGGRPTATVQVVLRVNDVRRDGGRPRGPPDAGVDGSHAGGWEAGDAEIAAI